MSASKSPFMVFQHLITPEKCAQIAKDVHVQPVVDEEGVSQPVARRHPVRGQEVFNYLKPHLPDIQKYYGFEYRGTEDPVFQQFSTTNGKLAEEPHCENAVYKRKKWIRINDRVLTGVIWLKDYNDTSPFDLKRHVYGGKLEFPVYNFGFQPQVGTMIIYPACERFISLTTSIQVGELQLARFHIYGEDTWIYDHNNFPGDMRTWFTDVV
jgi:hypothetical protein